MKRQRTIVLVLLALILGGAFVKANTNYEFLENGFIALYYHAVRLEETFPRINPMGVAISEFEKAAKQKETAGEAQLMMGLIYQYLDRPGTALGYLIEFAELHPEETWVHSLIGDMYAEMGRIPEAEASYRRAVEGSPEETVLAQTYVGLGNAALERGDFEAAKEAFQIALDSAGDYVDARLGLGKALYFLEDYEESITTLEMAQLQAPRSTSLLYYLGNSYQAAGLLEQAEHAFARIEELAETR